MTKVTMDHVEVEVAAGFHHWQDDSSGVKQAESLWHRVRTCQL